MKIKFWGASGEVTGSNYFLEDQGTKVLIDCGMFQGNDESMEKNLSDFNYNPNEIEALLVTHAHVDHIGRIPKLIHDGFKGPIFSTAPTKDLAYEILLDSYEIMVKKMVGNDLLPYDTNDINQAMSQWSTVSYHQKFSIKNFAIEYCDAGHILGSGSIKITSGSQTIIFSGDIGNVPSPIVKDPESFSKTDWALIESTYGARIHENVRNRKNLLKDIIVDTVNRKGVLLIPAFAMERTQELLYELNELVNQGQLPTVPIFVDSALGVRLTSIYNKYSQDPAFFDTEAIKLEKSGDDIFDFPGLKYAISVDDSKKINDAPAPKVIIASSGMGEGGRIIHHEVRYLPDPNNTVLFVGFQAVGTRGRQILEGAPKINVLDQDIEVKAQIKSIGGYSAHADQLQLIAWAKKIDKNQLKNIFIVHGDHDQAEVLAKLLQNELGFKTIMPVYGQTIDLE